MSRTGSSRQVEIDAGRLPRWIEGFAERHGPATVTALNAEQIEVTGQDGAVAVLLVSFPSGPLAPEGADPGTVPTPLEAAAAVIANAERMVEQDLAVLLIRRGGYAIAALTAGRVTASKVGSKYVQGRTAAGGWSQQRFARRRDGQVHGLLVSAADVAVRLLTPLTAQVLVTGGDKALIDRLLADPRLAEVGRLPRGPHLDVSDPRNEDVLALPVTLRQIRVQLDEP